MHRGDAAGGFSVTQQLPKLSVTGLVVKFHMVIAAASLLEVVQPTDLMETSSILKNVTFYWHNGVTNWLRTWYLFGPALAATTSRPSTSAYRFDGESSHSALTCAMKAASLTIMASVVVYESTAYLQPAVEDAIAYSDRAARMQWMGFILENRNSGKRGKTWGGDVGVKNE